MLLVSLARFRCIVFKRRECRCVHTVVMTMPGSPSEARWETKGSSSVSVRASRVNKKSPKVQHERRETFRCERDSSLLSVEMSEERQTSCRPTPNSRSPSVLCQSVGRGACREVYKGLRRICENCWAKVCPVFMRQNCDPASQERDAFSRPAMHFYGQRRACGNDWPTQLS